jgi:hypothetical protein
VSSQLVLTAAIISAILKLAVIVTIYKLLYNMMKQTDEHESDVQPYPIKDKRRKSQRTECDTKNDDVMDIELRARNVKCHDGGE